MAIIVDCVVKLGLDAAKVKLINLKSQKEMRDKLSAFMERQMNINEKCTTEEELDFEGLSEYIREELLEDVKTCIFGEKAERQNAWNSILSKAAIHAQANTGLSNARAMKLTTTAIGILRKFYRKKANQDLLLIAAEIEDNISDDTRGQLSAQAQHIESVIEPVSRGIAVLSSKIDSVSLLSIDKSLQLLHDGKITDIESNISAYNKAISSSHVLAPFYGYKLTSDSGNSQLQSVPLSKEALEKYPPRIRCVGTISMGGQQIREFSTDTIEYANMHQLTIIFNIQEAHRFLGNTSDPIQREAESLKGECIVMPPKPFPEALPCGISLDGSVEYDYILLRTQEIQDDGTIIVSNKEQRNCPLRICMLLYVNERKIDYKISLENPNNSDVIRYLTFLKKASKGAKITINALSLGKNIIEARTSPFIDHCGFNSSDDEISFLEKVISIEKFFATSVELPKDIMLHDFETISHLAALIGGNECEGNWKRLEFPIELSEKIKREIHDLDDTQYCMSCSVVLDLEIYGKRYSVPIRRTLKQVRFHDIAKMKMKADVMDIGDMLKVICMPGENGGVGSYVDVLEQSSTSDRSQIILDTLSE